MGQQLEQLLQNCTLKIKISSRNSWGTGFLIAPGLILTCFHVVGDEGTIVEICWQNKENFGEAVVKQSLPQSDLALLSFNSTASNLPCVYLDESIQADDRLYTYGYPDDFPTGASVTATCEGMTGDTPSQIKFKGGQIRPGLSGSPLLNQRTGKVCGVVKFTSDRSIDLGGGAVSASEVLLQFPELVKLQQEFHQQNKRWTRLLPRHPNQAGLSRQEYRYRQDLLELVNSQWIKGVLQSSLYHQVLIDLNLEERPDAVDNPWNMVLQIPNRLPKLLPQGTKITALFDDAMEKGRTLLVLGAPGSGKTTLLLELARDLIIRAKQDIELSIPVIFNLSSWATWIIDKEKKQGKKDDLLHIGDWLVEELNAKYGVPKLMGQTQIKEDKLILLLDGLDEVRADYREQCLIALNRFYRESHSEIVVCSRIKDYEALSNHLSFQTAVELKPLTLKQVHCYFERLGSRWVGLRTLIEQNEAVQDLATSPLMLNIMTLAYQGVPIETLPQSRLVEEWQQQLFDAYRIHLVS